MIEISTLLIALSALFVLIFIGVPLAFSFFLVGFFGLVYMQGFDLAIVLVGNTAYQAIANWLYLVIPMFILMGDIAGESGIITDIFSFFKVWMGRTRGALGIVTILTSALFAFATGSTVAATAVIGKLALPEMLKSNYDEKLSLGCIVAGGTLGNIIPPSIGLVLFGIIADVPIRSLLIGGILPGLTTALMFILWIVSVVIRNPKAAPLSAPSSWKEKVFFLKRIWGLLVVIITIFGSLYSGIATVTEAATVGCFVTFLIALLRRKLSLAKLQKILISTGLVTSMIFLLLVTITVFSRFLNFSGFTREIVRLAISSGAHPWIIMSGIYLAYLILGCLVDPASLILLTVPVIFPIVVKLGFDPVWFGVMSIIWMQIGFLTPPVGMAVYVLQGVSNAPLERCFSSAVYPLICWFIVAFLVSIFPGIATWLPATMR